MASPKHAPLLGYLHKEGCDEHDSYEILFGADLLIGRDSKRCQILVENPSISNYHLRIYSTIYDLEVEPVKSFVYALDLSINGSYWRYKRGNHWNETKIGKGNAVLLSDGEKVRLCNGSCFIFRSAPPQTGQLKGDHIQKKEIKSFSNLYRMTDRVLGTGSFGQVIMAIDCFRQHQVACKIVNLRSLPLREKDFAVRLRREVDLLKDISHPNIIHVERFFETKNTIYIIEDLVTGGDLMSYIERRGGKVDGTDACLIIYQILKAVEYLHSRTIMHRDLKPENVLMSVPVMGTRIILTDFGQSAKAIAKKGPQTRRMLTSCGTWGYVAPEIYGKNKLVTQEGYTLAADMWAVGALTSVLLTGNPFFADAHNPVPRRESSADPAALMNTAEECDLDNLEFAPEWQIVDDRARDLVRKLFVLDEDARLKVVQALEHPWFVEGHRKETICGMYENAVKGWMQSRPGFDFGENLDVFMKAREWELESKAYSSPGKAMTTHARKRLVKDLQKIERTSPHFAVKARDSALTTATAKRSKRLQVLEEENESSPNLSQRRSPSLSKTSEFGSVNDSLLLQSAKPPQASSEPTKQHYQEKSLTRIVNSCRVNGLSTEGSLSIPLDDEEHDLRLQMAREKPTFRTARSLGLSFNKRRKLKA